jgi:hypothetical protein
MFSKWRLIVHMQFSSRLRNWHGSAAGMEIPSTLNESARRLVLKPGSQAWFSGQVLRPQTSVAAENTPGKQKSDFLKN